MPADENEVQLITRAREGDTAAFGELAAAHERFVYNLCLRAVGEAREAEDLAQEAFLRAWLGLRTFRGEARFSTWLYRIVMNLAYNRRPRLKRELSELPVDEDLALPAPEDWRPAPAVESEEERAILREEVQALPDSQRVMILLRYQQDCSYEEIAGILDIPLGTVKTGLFRAHARLREALGHRLVEVEV